MSLAFIAIFNVYIGKMREVQQQYLAGTHTYEDTSSTLQPMSPALQQHGTKVVVAALGTLFASMAVLFAYFVVRNGILDGATIRIALALSYTIATVTTIFVLHRLAIFDFSSSSKSFVNGMGRIMPILCILILAWTLSDVMVQLKTGEAIALMLDSVNFPSWMLASVIFFVGAGLSLATGTSWGTFAVIIPIVVTTAFALDAPVAVCLGAALSGGLFGDHTSPISDTTVLSSMASGVNHLSHVETQFPYAMITAALSFVGFMVASLLAQGGAATPFIPVLIMAGMAGIAYFLLSRSRLAAL